MTEAELKERFKKFSIRIVKMVDSLPNTLSARAIGGQVVRSGTSPGANYRAACIAKSEKDFLNKFFNSGICYGTALRNLADFEGYNRKAFTLLSRTGSLYIGIQ